MTGFQSPNTSISWYYTWSPTPVTYGRRSSRTTSDFSFVPQFWGIETAYSQNFMAAAANNFSNARLTDDRAILTYNEPNQVGQADCTASEAAKHWREYVIPLREQGYRISSPAMTSHPDGKVWLQDFLGNCTECQWDFTAVHWYDLEIDNFISYLNDLYYTFNKTIWVTEFACQNFNPQYNGPGQASEAEIQAFMNASLDFLDNTPWVERYAWFAPAYDMVDVNPLNSLLRNTSSDFDQRSGALSDLGVAFAKSNNSVTSGSGGGSGGGGGWGGGGYGAGIAVRAGWLSGWVAVGTVVVGLLGAGTI